MGKPEGHRLKVRLSPELWAALRQLASEIGVKEDEWLRLAIELASDEVRGLPFRGAVLVEKMGSDGYE